MNVTGFDVPDGYVARYVLKRKPMPERYYERERRWCDELREAGIKAAHPDDGWVDREANTVRLEYPQFVGPLAVGDVIALGQPEGYRLVRLTGTVEAGPIMAPCMRPGEVYRYSFEPVGQS
jgi:hypothetical protein